jgi:hypothetical protein
MCQQHSEHSEPSTAVETVSAFPPPSDEGETSDDVLAAPQAEVSCPSAEILPETLAEVGQRSIDLFTQHLRADVNAYGTPWELSKSNSWLKIWKSKVPGQSRMVWKAQWTVSTNCGSTRLMSEFRSWPRRLKHDQMFAEGSVLRKFSDDDYELDHCRTKQILTVAPREFIDLRYWHPLPDEEGFFFTFTSLKSNDDHAAELGLPAPRKGLVRGENLAGSGMKWTLLPADEANADLGKKKTWSVHVVAESDPKGWIPASVINNAMAMQLTEQIKASVKYFSCLPAAEA